MLPIIVIVSTYLIISMYALSFNIAVWTPDDRFGLLIMSMLSVLGSMFVNLVRSCDL